MTSALLDRRQPQVLRFWAMPFPPNPHDHSVLTTGALTLAQITDIFKRAESYRESFGKNGSFQSAPDSASKKSAITSQSFESPIVSLLFFEPSTRTRMSFEIAALRLGYRVQIMDSASTTSLTKGESLTDTVINVLAMRPDALVIRYGKSMELDRLLPTLQLPVLNAGSGVVSHPSQALLDAWTIRQNLHEVSGQKVLIVGDIRHSRVANSNFDLLLRLGAEVAVCGPKEFLPLASELPTGVKIFEELDEAVAWATVYMALRIQLERHVDEPAKNATGASKSRMNQKLNHGPDLDLPDFHAQFGLSPRRLKILRKDAIILHPGPINHGVELSDEAIHDSRARILNQVENGVYIRAALLARALEV